MLQEKPRAVQNMHKNRVIKANMRSEIAETSCECDYLTVLFIFLLKAELGHRISKERESEEREREREVP